MRRICAVAAVLAVVAVLTGCSSGGASAGARDTGSLRTSTSSPAATVRAPAGLPSFYAIPDPLPAGKPGDVIKTETVPAASLHGTLLRVMYHSKSLQGDDIPVTGLIAVPSAAPPSGGYPVISWAHGTTGIADTCAPSLSPDDYAQLANNLLDAGYLVVATDYEGLGTPGRHPYIVGDSEARGVLDIVRAARKLRDAHASNRYVVWGHSQGGHAAMFALHIADTWAPELHLLGVVAGAPPSQLSFIYQALLTSPYKYYLLMAAAGFNAGYGDDGAPLPAVLSPAGVQAVSLVDQGCAGDVGTATASIATADLVAADPNTVPAWAKLLVDNDPGRFTSASAEPLLIIQGGNDEQIPVVSTELLFTQLCAINQVTQRWIYPGQSHAGVIAPSFKDMLTWINRRFAGAAAPDTTPPTGQPDVQAQNCPG